MKSRQIGHELSSTDHENANFIFNLQKKINTHTKSIDSLFSELLKDTSRARRRAKLIKLGGSYLNSAYQRHVIISQNQAMDSLFSDIFNWWLFLRFEMNHTFVQVSRLFDYLNLTTPQWPEIKSAFRKLDSRYSDYQFRFRKLDFSTMENWEKSAQPVLVQHIRRSFSRGLREAILNPPFSEVIGIRPVLTQTTAEQLVSILETEDIPARLSRRTDYGVICQRHSSLHETTAFKNKLFDYLDEADELFLELISPYIGQHNGIAGNLIPHILSVMTDQYHYETKLTDVVNGRISTLENMPVFTNLFELLSDETPPTSHRFDSVIITANDSQCGFIARNPLFKYNIAPDYFEKNEAAIRQQLDFCAPLVKKDKYLIFYSHSVLPIETELIISAFLSRHPEFEPQRLQDELLQNYNRNCFTPNGFTTAPYLKQMNGLFLSVMKRKDNDNGNG